MFKKSTWIHALVCCGGLMFFAASTSAEEVDLCWAWGPLGSEIEDMGWYRVNCKLRNLNAPVVPLPGAVVIKQQGDAWSVTTEIFDDHPCQNLLCKATVNPEYGEAAYFWAAKGQGTLDSRGIWVVEQGQVDFFPAETFIGCWCED